jgi:hypothetical protein
MSLIARCLIGSSNVSRFYKSEDFPNFTICNMTKCCTMETFMARMDSLEEEENEVIVSVLENFFCDAVGNIKDEKQIDEKIEEVLTEFLKVVETAAKRLVNTKFALSQPIRRPRDKWYTARLHAITKKFCDGIGKIGLDNVSWIEAPREAEQIFEDFGVHLTKESGIFFVESLMSKATEFFNAEMVVLPMDVEDETEEEIIPLEVNGKKKKTGRIDSIEKDLGEFRADVLRRRHFDSMVTMRLSENQDVEQNKAREDRIVINGLTNPVPCPTGYEDKEKWLKDMVAPLVDSIVPESSKEIAFINLAGNKERDIPLCEVKFKNRDIAIKIRREFAAKKKGGKDFGRLAVFNSVTLATRVRIEVLWAIAKKRGSEKEIATVQSYVSKPTLIIKDKEGKRKPLKLGYADAINRFGKTLREGDLASAYRKAGTSFQNVLQQNFVVLHDLNKSKVGPWGGKGGATDGFPQTGLKRVREPKDKPKPSLNKPKPKATPKSKQNKTALKKN